MDARILELCRQWQQSSLWDLARHLAKELMTCAMDEDAAMNAGRTLQSLHGQLVILQELVRRERPDCLHLIPPVDFLREYASLDVPGRIRDLMQLEGVILKDAGRYAGWLRIRQVARGLNINSGGVTRLVAKGELKDNEKTGTERRIDPASVLRYCQEKNLEFNCDPNPD